MNSNYNRFFIPTPISTGQVIELPNYVINKLVNTLRQKQGDKIRIFNENKEFSATILELKTGRIKIIANKELAVIKEPAVKLHLFQCILKNQNMDLVIQKITELGATEFTPILSKNALVKLQSNKIEKKMAHWFEISRHATEQCGRIKLLKLNHPIKLDQVFVENNVASCFVLNSKDGKRLLDQKKLNVKLLFVAAPKRVSMHQKSKFWRKKVLEIFD